MPSRRKLQETASLTSDPPASLPSSQSISRIVKAAGNNLYTVAAVDGKELLVELPSRFRSAIWLRRGGYVLVDTSAFAERENKLDGEIVNVVMNEKLWRKMDYWPEEFKKVDIDDDDDE